MRLQAQVVPEDAAASSESLPCLFSPHPQSSRWRNTACRLHGALGRIQVVGAWGFCPKAWGHLRTPTNSDVSLKSPPQPCDAFRQPQLLSAACLCPLGEKKAQPKSWELCFIWQTSWWCKPGTALSDHSEGPLQRGKGGARVYRSFYNKHQVVGTSKDYCSSEKTTHLKLRNSELFYVWEDARVWAHWNHSSNVHLSCLGPVSHVFSAWVTLGCFNAGWLQAGW